MMKPRCRTAGNLFQLRYSLPYDIQASTVYPLTSPNGSSVIICGHRAGLFIAWHGGRPLKEQSSLKTKSGRPTSPKASQSDVMVIDLDESDSEEHKDGGLAFGQSTEPLSPAEPAEFDDEEPEPDPRHPYPPLVQTLDLPVAGGGTTRIAVPTLSNAAKAGIAPELLKTHMLLALSCADAAIRLLLLPLLPPSHEAKTRKELAQRPRMAEAGMGSWGETLVDVPRGLGHRLLVDGISVGVAPRQLVVDEDEDDDEGRDAAEEDMQIEGDAARRRQRVHSVLEGWDVLVASASADAGGTLLIHRVPITRDGRDLDAELLHVWRNVLLRNPATGIDLHAGSTARMLSYPKILVAEADGPVRIYECSDEESRDEGRWVDELYARKSDRNNRREGSRHILVARFILGGHAVVGLMSDGEWGVWDISRPSESSQLSFAYNYRIPSASSSTSKSLKATSSGALSKPSQSSSLAPMTPHTRKVRQQALFADNSSSKANTPSRQLTSDELVALKGGISINPISHEASTPADDAHALVYYGDTTVFVPNMRARHLEYLRAAAAQADSSSSSSPSASALIAANDPFSSNTSSSAVASPRQIHVPDPAGLCGGSRISTALLPLSSSSAAARGTAGSSNGGGGSGVRTKMPEIYVASERAFSFVGYPRSADSEAWRTTRSAMTTMTTTADESKRDKRATAASGGSGLGELGTAGLLKGAELAIDGIEGMLDRMAGGAKRLSGRA